MSGGIAYIYDEDGSFASYCNTVMVTLEPLLTETEQDAKVSRDIWHMGLADEIIARRYIENHARLTGSTRAQQILASWATARSKFVKVFPNEYRRALGELAAKGKKIAA